MLTGGRQAEADTVEMDLAVTVRCEEAQKSV